MVDAFSIKGTNDSYEFDKACIEFSHAKHDTRFVKKMVIPNREKTTFLDASYLKHKPQSLWINGNLRKWWFESGRAVRDLSFSELIEALEFLAKRLNTDLEKLVLMPITNVEIGMNLKLDKEAKLFIPALMEMPQLERVRYGMDSVYFKAEKYQEIFYNKIQQMHEKENLSAVARKRILDNIFILRYEKQIKAPSGYKHPSYVKNFDSLIRNFDNLIDDLLDSFMSVEFVDPLCKGKNIESQSLTMREFQQYLIFLATKEYGIDFLSFMSDSYVKNHNAESRRQLREIYDKFNTNENRQHFAKIALKLFEKSKYLRN